MISSLSKLLAFSYNNTTTTSSSHANGAVIAIAVLVGLAFAIFVIAAMWKVFQKAGRPGWAAIVPIYNSWVLFEIAGKPGWWVLPLVVVAFIPIIGALIALVVAIIVYLELAKRFGRGPLFAILGLVLFSFIGFPILGFGDAQYHNPEDDAPTVDNRTPGGTPGLWSQTGAGPTTPPANAPTTVQPSVPVPPAVSQPLPQPEQPVTNPLPPEQPQGPDTPA